MSGQVLPPLPRVCSRCADGMRAGDAAWAQYARSVVDRAGDAALAVWTRRGEVSDCLALQGFVHLRGSAAREADAMLAGVLP